MQCAGSTACHRSTCHSTACDSLQRVFPGWVAADHVQHRCVWLRGRLLPRCVLHAVSPLWHGTPLVYVGQA